MHTIVITGGHHNSALVVAKEIIARGHKVVWIGHRYSSRGDTVDSAEYIEVTSAKIPFHDLRAGKLVASLHEAIHLPIGLYQALSLLLQIKPKAILSFGGYLGGTVALAAKLLGIEVYLHEQTITAGRANKFIGRLAKKIYLTWPESSIHFDPAKQAVVGLPLRDGIKSPSHRSLFTRKKPTLLVMGGKQGAHVLNQFIFTHLLDLLASFNIVHQTGTSSLTGDYDHALSLQNQLGSLGDSYLPLGYISEAEIGSYLKSSHYYFGRSGAHICYELGVLGIKSILTPLMSTHDHEQLKNARILVKSNHGLVLPESELTYPNFRQTIHALSGLSPRKLNLPLDASSRLVSDFLSELG